MKFIGIAIALTLAASLERRSGSPIYIRQLEEG